MGAWAHSPGWQEARGRPGLRPLTDPARGRPGETGRQVWGTSGHKPWIPCQGREEGASDARRRGAGAGLAFEATGRPRRTEAGGPRPAMKHSGPAPRGGPEGPPCARAAPVPRPASCPKEWKAGF